MAYNDHARTAMNDSFGSTRATPVAIREAVKATGLGMLLPARIPHRWRGLSQKSIEDILHLYKKAIGTQSPLRKTLKPLRTDSNPPARPKEAWELFLSGLSKNFSKLKRHAASGSKKAWRAIKKEMTDKDNEDEALKRKAGKMEKLAKELERVAASVKGTKLAKESKQKKPARAKKNPLPGTEREVSQLSNTIERFHATKKPRVAGEYRWPAIGESADDWSIKLGNMIFICYASDREGVKLPYFHGHNKFWEKTVNTYIREECMDKIINEGDNERSFQKWRGPSLLIHRGLEMFSFKGDLSQVSPRQYQYIQSHPSEFLLDQAHSSRKGISVVASGDGDVVAKVGDIMFFGYSHPKVGLSVYGFHNIFADGTTINRRLRTCLNEAINSARDDKWTVGSDLVCYKDMKTFLYRARFTDRGIMDW